MTLHMWDCSLCVYIALFDYHCLIRLSLTSSKLSNDKDLNKTNVHLPSEWLVGKCTVTVRINKPLKKKEVTDAFQPSALRESRVESEVYFTFNGKRKLSVISSAEKSAEKSLECAQ